MVQRFRALLLTSLVSVVLMAPARAESLLLEVRDATVAVDHRANDLAVLTVRLVPAAQDAFARFTTANVGRRAEIRIDGKVMLKPIIREPILSGSLQISGPPLEELRMLAKRLSAGGVNIEVELVPD